MKDRKLRKFLGIEDGFYQPYLGERGYLVGLDREVNVLRKELRDLRIHLKIEYEHRPTPILVKAKKRKTQETKNSRFLGTVDGTASYGN